MTTFMFITNNTCIERLTKIKLKIHHPYKVSNTFVLVCIGIDIDVYVNVYLYDCLACIYLYILFYCPNTNLLIITIYLLFIHRFNRIWKIKTLIPYARNMCVCARASKSLILLLALALKISRLIVKSACLSYILPQQQRQQHTLNTIWAHRRNDRFARFWFFKLLESSNSSNGNNSNNNENTSHTKHEP